uniref:(northern house mosquito) hypothetical protein n=1 Tax=Culex pipiens TaxID=7175 RepID=A0A8D8GEY2_CULPI
MPHPLTFPDLKNFDFNPEIFNKYRKNPYNVVTPCKCDNLPKGILVRGRFVTLTFTSTVYIFDYNSGFRQQNSTKAKRGCYCLHFSEHQKATYGRMARSLQV